MKRTQVQLPDWLFAAAGHLAAEKEISLAELVRRGLEYMVSITPESVSASEKWQLPRPSALGSRDPFMNQGWREEIHARQLMVAEEPDEYVAGDSH